LAVERIVALTRISLPTPCRVPSGSCSSRRLSRRQRQGECCHNDGRNTALWRRSFQLVHRRDQSARDL